MYRNGIEVKRDADMCVIVEKSSWLDIAEKLYPDTEKIYYPNDQDHVLHVKHKDTDIAFISGQGSSMAACMTERLIVYGAKAIIRIGTCGSLSDKVSPWKPIITTSCFSDEGTTSHYLPKKFPIISNPELNELLKNILNKHKIDYYQGPTITTDGRWREDPKLLENLSKIGVISIEMETAAILAVCHFRKKLGAAINIPTDSPIEHTDNDFKGIPDREAYPTNILNSLNKLIPPVVDTLTDLKKQINNINIW